MRNKAAAVLAIVAALLLGVPSVGAEPVAGDGAVRGVVQDSSGRPVVGADVDVLDPATDVVLATASTDSAGRYEAAVADGTYDLRLRLPANADGIRPRQVTPGVIVDGPTAVRLIAMPDPAFVRVSGVVRDAAGDGFPKAQLWFRQGVGGNVITAAPENTFDTRPPGTFDTLVPAGLYDFVVRTPRDQPTMDVAFPLELTEDLATDFVLPVQLVSVTTLRPDGAPASGISVRPGFSPSVDVQVTPTIVGKGSFFNGATTDAAGVATFRSFVTSSDLPVLATVPANLSYGSGSGVVPAGATSTTVTLPATVPVHGTVRDAQGAPVVGAFVGMMPAPTSGSPGGPGPSTTTNAAGEYSLLAVPGAYRLSTTSSSGGATPTAPRSSAVAAIDVDVAGDTTRDLVSTETVPVTVLVLDADGNPAASAPVSASSYPTTPTPVAPAAAAFSSATTAADGTAVLRVLPGVASVFSARPSSTGFGFATGATLSPSEGETVELRFPTPVPVTGTARFDGVPLAGVKVTVSAGPGRVEGTTDADGRFSVAAPPGEARIGLNRSGGFSSPQPTFNVDGPVTIGAGGREIDLDVPAAHVEFRASGMELPALNANSFAMAPATFGFPFADGLGSGFWGRSESTSAGSSTTTVLLPAKEMKLHLGMTSVTFPIADGDLVVLTRAVADDAAPAIEAVLSPAANEYRWSTGDTTVSFVCTDDLDPQPTCPEPVTVSEESSSTVVDGASTDHAGNRSRIAVPVRLDRTAPAIAARSSAATAPAWTNGDVRVAFDCDDALSGVLACPSEQVVSGEGSGLSVVGVASDRAGHTSSATATFNIDRTAPTIEAAGFLVDGWSNAPVDVTFRCADGLSGVASCPAGVSFADDGEHLFRETATDVAGNVGSVVGLVRVDRTAPTATPRYPAGAVNGWYRTGVEVPLECGDALSGVSSCGRATFASAGSSLTQVAEAVDRAGNRTAVPVTVSIDPDAPETSVEAKTVAVGGDRYVAGSATDALSGVQRVRVRFTGVLGTVNIAEAKVRCSASGCTWMAKLPARPDRYTVAARASDVAGNVDPTPVTTTVVGVTA